MIMLRSFGRIEDRGTDEPSEDGCQSWNGRRVVVQRHRLPEARGLLGERGQESNPARRKSAILGWIYPR